MEISRRGEGLDLLHHFRSAGGLDIVAAVLQGEYGKTCHELKSGHESHAHSRPDPKVSEVNGNLSLDFTGLWIRSLIHA